MAFEINFNNPTDGGTAFLASYLGAKKKADAETARLKALQQQRMADTIGGAIGNVGGSFGRGWSEGVVNRYRMQDQQKLDADRAELNAKYQEQRDARQFDYDKQITKYRTDLSRDEKFYDNFQMSPDDAESLGQREWESAPPQVRGQIASSLGLDPEQADTLFAGDGPEAKALRRQTAITSIRMREQGAKVEQARQIAQIRADRDMMIKRQEMQLNQVNGWMGGKVRVSNPQIEATLRQEQTAIDKAELDGEYSPQQIAESQRQLNTKILRHMDKMEPVEQPATTFQDWASGRPPKPGVPYVAPDGRMTIFDAKGSPHTSAPVKGETTEPPPVIQPGMQFPTYRVGGDEYGYDPIAKKSVKIDNKESPEQKREAEKNKKLTDFVAGMANEMVPTFDPTTGIKKGSRPHTDAERREKIRQFKAGLEEINDDSEIAPLPKEHSPVLTTPDAQGYSYMDRVQYAVDKNPDPAAVNAMIGRFKIATELKQELYDFAKSRRESRQAPQQQAAPQQQKYPEGTVAEDASGNRRVMKNGQWVPINGG